MKPLEIKLLHGHKFDRINIPCFWDYIEEFNKIENQFFDVNGTKLFRGDSADFLKMAVKTMTEIPTWRPREPEWTIEQFLHGHARETMHIAVTPDGQVFVRKMGGTFFMTAVRFSGFTKTGKVKSTKKAKSRDVAFRYMTNRHDEVGDKLRQPIWSEVSDVLEFLEAKGFTEAFKATRASYLKSLKEDPKWAEQQERIKARRLAERTNRKMRVCNQVTTVIQLLQTYLKSINDGTATQSQVGEIYHEMNTLGSLNKKVKTLFPKE